MDRRLGDVSMDRLKVGFMKGLEGYGKSKEVAYGWVKNTQNKYNLMSSRNKKWTW